MIDLQGFGNQFLLGASMTMQLAAGALVLGLVLGLIGAAGKLSKSKIANALAGTYTTLIRGLPELLIVLIIYYGTAGMLTQIAGWFGHDEYVELSPYAAGVTALGITFGSYATEVFRGAIQAIPKGQIEAAHAMGMGSYMTFFRIILPQVWRIALPGLGNLFLVLLKDTALVSLIGLDELMRKTSVAISNTREPFTFYLVAAFIYLALTILTMTFMNFAERRANRGFVRAGS
ncbi:MAG: ABC transporter permease [Rhodospirillales bacterium]|nr:ABC transporter permease [Rhodospirillales bacterium]